MMGEIGVNVDPIMGLYETCYFESLEPHRPEGWGTHDGGARVKRINGLMASRLV